LDFTYRTTYASLSWDEAGLPYSRDYGDVYYSRADALGESSHVFLAGNALESRFRDPVDSRFIIGELGFGAGLNFLNTCRLWCTVAPPSACLHYLACELHPFSLEDLRRVHTLFPELAPWSKSLLDALPLHTAGLHQVELTFGQRKVCLTLVLADVADLPRILGADCHFKVDAWFLDGFSPKTNPAMWQSDLLHCLARLSHSGSTLSSYSVAADFRQQIEIAGFRWEKISGFATKRHMLRARLASPTAPAAPPENERLVCVIGAGLAGCSTARALARSGWDVILVESGDTLASGASGNPQGVLHFKPATVDTADNRFNLHAFLYASRFYQSLGLPLSTWSRCGMLQLAHDSKMQKRFATLAEAGVYANDVLQVLEAEHASHLAGHFLSLPALHVPLAGWAAPVELCRHYCSEPGISVLTGYEVGMIDQGPRGWEIIMHSSRGEHFLHCAQVVLCTSADVHRFIQTRHLPVIGNRGQVDVYASNAASHIGPVLCGQGYIIPASGGIQTIGGSFFVEGAEDPAEKYRLLHLAQLRAINPGLAEALSGTLLLEQRTSTRCTLADRMPVVGAVDASRYPGLWVNVGHGSQGLARTPASAALLASLLNATPAPLAADCIAVISPSRYGTGPD
jgi:tRNA 5-methylaminomethyl-2-thiouridine biosynthesis bifunctional protein